MDQAVRTALADFIIEDFLFGDATRLPGDGASLTDAGVMDSTGVLELIEFLESRFGIEVAESETVPENLDSVAALVRYVSGKRAGLATSA